MKHAEIVRKVQWKDLSKLTVKEMLIENNISIPWALASWGLAWYGYYIWALPFSAIFFLTAFRQVHNGFHNSLGTSRFLTWFSLFFNSMLMQTSLHAVKYNHLQHHKHCLGENDIEGKSAGMSWWRAILYGPKHIWLIHKVALQQGNVNYRRSVLAEMAAAAVFFVLVLVFNVKFLVYHCIVMIAGELLSAFFAVWSVHRDCDEETIARTQRSGWKNAITYNMFYHLEHHLFPAVPTIKLKELARRIDEAAPELEKKSAF